MPDNGLSEKRFTTNFENLGRKILARSGDLLLSSILSALSNLKNRLPLIFEKSKFSRKGVTMNMTITEPGILTANTYFWGGAGNASSRRRNEERHQAAVADFFAKIGLRVERSGDNVIAKNDDLTIVFHYSESCKNVYKTLSVTRENGKKSNITALRKLYQ